MSRTNVSRYAKGDDQQLVNNCEVTFCRVATLWGVRGTGVDGNAALLNCVCQLSC